MSLRIDTSEWISGALLIGNTGLGVIGSLIPSEGDNGAALAYNDLSLPADADKEIRIEILTRPSAGTLFVNEDTSFTFSGPDGAYSFSYRLYVDGVATGSPVTVSLSVGLVTHSTSGALSAGAATVTGTVSRTGAVVLTTHTSVGALVSRSAVVTATASRSGIVLPVTHGSSGVLVARAAVIRSIASGTITPGEITPERIILRSTVTPAFGKSSIVADRVQLKSFLH